MKSKIKKYILIALCCILVPLLSFITKIEFGKSDIAEFDRSEFKIDSPIINNSENFAPQLRSFKSPEFSEEEHSYLEDILAGQNLENKQWINFTSKHRHTFDKINSIISLPSYRPETVHFEAVPKEIENEKILLISQLEMCRIKFLEEESNKVEALLKLMKFGMTIKQNSISVAGAYYSSQILITVYENLTKIIKESKNKELLWTILKDIPSFSTIEQTTKEARIALNQFCIFIEKSSHEALLKHFEMDFDWIKFSYFHKYVLHKYRTKKLLVEFYKEFSEMLLSTPNAKEFHAEIDKYMYEFTKRAKKGSKENYAGGMILLHYSWSFMSISSNSLTENKLNHLRVLCAKRLFEIENKSQLKNIDQLIPKYLNKIPHDFYRGEDVKFIKEDDNFDFYIKSKN